jgi:hypothetical protein
MPFRPLNEDEIKDIDRKIDVLEKEIAIRRRGIANLRSMKHDGAWVSELTTSSSSTAWRE